MASVKLVNGNPHHLHHHSLYLHHPHHHPPFLHHPLPLANPPIPTTSSPSPSPVVASGHPTTNTVIHSTTTTTTTNNVAAAAGMTLDYSLPNRSRLGDSDRLDQSALNLTATTVTNNDTNVDDNSAGHNDGGDGGHRFIKSDNTDRLPHSDLLNDHGGNSNIDTDTVNCNNSSYFRGNKTSCPDIVKQSPSSPRPTSVSAGSENPELQGMLDCNTPTKKNKRKLSEPRKLRSDIDKDQESGAISPSSPSPPETDGGILSPVDMRSDNSDDERETRSPAIKIPKFSSHITHHDSNSIPKQCPSTKYQSIRRSKQSSPPSNSEHFLASSTPPPSASSSSPSSSSSPQITQSNSATHSDTNDTPGLHDKSSPNMPNGLQAAPPPFLHPFLSAVPPAAFGMVPGLYLPGQPYPTPSALPTTFPGIPLHLQQSYFAAAAAAAAAAQSAAGSSSSSSQPSTSSTQTQPNCSSSSSFLSSRPSSETVESSQSYKHRNSSSSHPVILQPPQLHNNLQHQSFRKSPHTASGDSGAGSSNSSNSFKNSKSTTSSHMSRISQPQSSPTPLTSEFHQRVAQSSSIDNNQINDEDDDDDVASSSRVHSPEDLSMGGKMSRKHRKNYKNMTRERRVEANARERTRVHTISAAFDALRRAVPSYSYNQKLSKLAILRIACSYIMSLARLADLDYTSASEHIQRPLTFAECVDMCTNTIQTEGRARRRH